MCPAKLMCIDMCIDECIDMCTGGLCPAKLFGEVAPMHLLDYIDKIRRS